jgi:hypothetical protein
MITFAEFPHRKKVGSEIRLTHSSHPQALQALRKALDRAGGSGSGLSYVRTVTDERLQKKRLLAACKKRFDV